MAEVKVPAGPLSIQLRNRPLAEELAARRAADALTLAGRKQADAALPGTRREVRFYENLTGQRKDLKQRSPRGEALREARQWLRGLTLPDIEQHVADWLAQVRGAVRERRPMGKPAGTRPFAQLYY